MLIIYPPTFDSKMPPPGVVLPAEDRRDLESGAAGLARDLKGLESPLKPDAEIFHKAVDWALRHDEFFDVKQVKVAQALLNKLAIAADTADNGSEAGRAQNRRVEIFLREPAPAQS